jgi:hypothetical protein
MIFFKKIHQLSSQTLVMMGSIFFLVVSVSSFVNTVSLYESLVTTTAVTAITLCGFLLVSHFINHYFSRRLFLLFLIVIGLIVRIIWILWINTPPKSDFSYMHSAAKKAAAGDFSFANTEYFTSWVYQLGFTMYEALVIKLFGGSILILKLLNVLFSVGTAVVVYFAASKALNEFCGRMASLSYALYIPNIIMCSVLTNQHLSSFFFMLGCLLLLKQGWNKKYQWIFIGLSFALGNMMRPLGNIFLIGFVVYVLLSQLLTSSKKQMWPVFAKSAGVIVVFYLVQSLVSYSFLAGGVTTYPLSSQEPYWKFMVGLNADTKGTWSMEDAEYAVKYKLGEERDQAELAVIKERLANKPAVAALLLTKLVYMWGSADGSAMWSLWELNKEDLNVWLNKFERITYVIMSAFGCLSLLALFRSRHSHDPLFFVILMLGYAAVHLVIEIQSRYRLDAMPAFMLLQSYGIYILHEKIQPLFAVNPKKRAYRLKVFVKTPK